MHPLEQLDAADVEAREVVLDRLRIWASEATSRFSGCSLMIHGSVARGDYWAGGDVDLLLKGGDDRISARMKQELQEALDGVAASVDLWPLSHTVQEFSARSTELRKLPNPIQFGLYGFDLVRHRLPLFGDDFLLGFKPSLGMELGVLARDRLTQLSSPGGVGFADHPRKKAIEAIKAWVLMAAASGGEPPTRDKRRVLSRLLRLIRHASQQRKAIAFWGRYRYGESLDESVAAADAEDAQRFLAALPIEQP